MGIAGGGREPAYVVEGEPDVISAAAAGLPAVAIPGAQGWQSGFAERLAAWTCVSSPTTTNLESGSPDIRRAISSAMPPAFGSSAGRPSSGKNRHRATT